MNWLPSMLWICVLILYLFSLLVNSLSSLYAVSIVLAMKRQTLIAAAKPITFNTVNDTFLLILLRLRTKCILKVVNFKEAGINRLGLITEGRMSFSTSFL